MNYAVCKGWGAEAEAEAEVDADHEPSLSPFPL